MPDNDNDNDNENENVNETEHDDTEHDEAEHDEAEHDEAEHEEAGRDEAGRDEAGRDEAGRDEAGRDEAGRDEAGRDEAGRDEAGREEAAHDDAGHDDAGHDDAGPREPGDDDDDNAGESESEGGHPAVVDESAFEGDDDEDDDDMPVHFNVVAHADDGPAEGDRPEPQPEGPPEIPLQLVDQDALWVVKRLHAKGYEAYLTGGCVRDLLLGRTPKDFDVATAAHPNQVKAVFRNCRLVGRRFRLAHVFFPSGKVIETATFRANPIDELEDLPQDLLVERDNVFGNVEQDARRRDLTVNGLFYDPLQGKVLDFVDGRRDLDSRLIRTIGNPEVRFREDPVRILRAIKFATRLGFTIEEETFAAMKAHVGELVRCAPARLQEELLRLLTSGHARASVDLCNEVGVCRAILGELEDALDMPLEARPFTPPPAPVPAPAPVADEDAAPAAAAAPGDEGAAAAPAETEAGDAPEDAAPAALPAAAEEAPEGAAAPSVAEGEPGDASVAPRIFVRAEPAPPPAPTTPAERRARLNALLTTLDEGKKRDLDMSSAAAFAVLLAPVWEAMSASTTDFEPWFEDATQQWMERIRLTRHDRERIPQILAGQEDLLPHRRYGQQARQVVHRPSFKESLLLYTLRLHAAGAPLDEIGLWKVVAQAANASYRQPRLSERGPRMRAVAASGGGGRSPRGRGRDRGGRRRRR